MAIKKAYGNIDVVTAARQRILNVFQKVDKVYLAFSSGKDSLCMSSLVYDLALNGEIDPKKLTVNFFDEEGLYKSMVESAERWRKRFIGIGAKFNWYCLPFKQVCTLDSLSASESWITWEPGKEGVWMRNPPPYAIVKSDYLHYAGEMNYAKFCDKAFSDGVTLIGLRCSESNTRLQAAATSSDDNRKFYPIYDWKDSDVWLYIKEHNLEFPEIYMRLYEAGVKKNMLRLSAFFGDKTTQGLRWVAETDPDFWERIEHRMPNAYLVMLYWDSEMFARNSGTRKELERDIGDVDYREKCKDLLFVNTAKYRINHDTLKTLKTWRNLFITSDGIATQKQYRRMFESIINGDPKGRDYRLVRNDIYAMYVPNLINMKEKDHGRS